jgi:putative oxidoreductase
MLKSFPWLSPQPDLGLLLLRLGGAVLLLMVHGLPKLQHYAGELAHIDDPLHIGRGLTCGQPCWPRWRARWRLRPVCSRGWPVCLCWSCCWCPCWPCIGLSLADGQFGWLLLVIFASISVAGAGRYTLPALLRMGSPAAAQPPSGGAAHG